MKPYSTTKYAFAIPPNKAKTQVTAPPIPPISFLLSMFKSGISSLPELFNAIDQIPSFNWQKQSDIDKYLNPKTRQPIKGKDIDFWASAKPGKPWNAKRSNVQDPKNKTTSAYVGPVLNQGSVGICYAVSSTDVISMRYSIQKDLDNSQNQQLFNIGEVVSCSSNSNVFDTSGVGPCPSQNNSINGGFPACVGAYVREKGIHKNDVCPFDSGINNACVQDNQCCSCEGFQKTPTSTLYYPIPKQAPSIELPNGEKESTETIVNYVQYYDGDGKLINPVPNPTDEQRKAMQRYMKLHILTSGPCVACFFAEDPDFQSYNGGIFVGSNPGPEPDHAVVIVGWGTSTSGPYVGEYWIVRNSWGTEWGDQENPGYFNFAMSSTSKNINTGYYLDYPKLDPVSGSSCTDAKGCQPLTVCYNGQCYTMFGGGTGFLVSGMGAIDAPTINSSPMASAVLNLNQTRKIQKNDVIRHDVKGSDLQLCYDYCNNQKPDTFTSVVFGLSGSIIVLLFIVIFLIIMNKRNFA